VCSCVHVSPCVCVCVCVCLCVCALAHTMSWRSAALATCCRHLIRRGRGQGQWTLPRAARDDSAVMRSGVMRCCTSRGRTNYVQTRQWCVRVYLWGFEADELTYVLLPISARPTLCAASESRLTMHRDLTADNRMFNSAVSSGLLSPGQGLRTRAKRTTAKQGLRYTPSCDHSTVAAQYCSDLAMPHASSRAALLKRLALQTHNGAATPRGTPHVDS
jgi:hypothetical protein